jgi:hypothetical protein
MRLADEPYEDAANNPSHHARQQWRVRRERDTQAQRQRYEENNKTGGQVAWHIRGEAVVCRHVDFPDW